MRSQSYSGSFLIVLSMLLTFPSMSAAQSVAEPKTWTVTPFLGGSFGTSNDLGSSLVLGAGIGYDVTSNLGFEGEIGYVFDVEGDQPNADWSITNFSANVVYHFNARRVTPYATVGLGVERSNLTIDDPDILALYPPDSNEVTYNFGGGLKYPLSQNFLARADLRRFQATDLAPDHWRFYGGLTWWIKR
jgi:opacity protein-like surface antigen